MSKIEHAGEWEYDKTGIFVSAADETPTYIAAAIAPTSEIRKKRAEFIVRACNAYDSDQEKIRDLLAACEELLSHIGINDPVGSIVPNEVSLVKARSAIAKAKPVSSSRQLNRVFHP